LREHSADHRQHHLPLTLAGVRERVAQEVHLAALPGRFQHLRHGGFQTLMRVRDQELHAGSARRVSERRNALQKGSASDGPTAIPSASRTPSVFTPTAIITATETIRPASRTFMYVASIHRYGQLPSNRPVQERLDVFIDVGAQPRYLGLADPAHPISFDLVLVATSFRPPAQRLLNSVISESSTRMLTAAGTLALDSSSRSHTVRDQPLKFS